MAAQPFTIEDTLAAHKSSSLAARDVFYDEKTTETLVALGEELNLSDEQAHVLGMEVGYVLIGLTDQNDFTDRLKASGFSPDTVNAILFEVMKKIFLPLSKQLNGEFKKNPAFANARPQDAEGGDGSASASSSPVQSLKPNPVTISVPRYMSAPPLQSPLYVRDEAKVPQLDGAVLPQKMTMPRAAVTLGVNDVEPLVRVTRESTPPSPAPQPQEMKAPVAPMEEPPAPPKEAARPSSSTILTTAPVADLPIGEEDVPVVKPAPAPLSRPMQTPTARMDVPKSIQIPPAALPAEVPPRVTQAWASPTSTAAQQNPPVPVPVAAKEPQAKPIATEKGYAADPYREPIDEKAS
jgi:hypothetical protein